MIDIEALADTPDSAPAEIALVFFSRDAPARAFATRHFEPSPISAIRLGFIVTTATLQWWDDQGMTIAVQQGEPLQDVLDHITAAIEAVPTPRPCASGRAATAMTSPSSSSPISAPASPCHGASGSSATCAPGSKAASSSPREKTTTAALDDANNQALDIIQATQATLTIA